jgi:hypothetical protein
MAHYAFLDNNTPPVVTEVIVGNDETTGDWEFYYSALRQQRCLRTSYNTIANKHSGNGVPFRGNYAGIGYVYLEDKDVFVPPCPGDGYVLDEATATWVPAQ